MIVLQGNPQSTNHLYRTCCRGKFPTVYMTADGKALKESYQWQVKSQWKQPILTDKIGVKVRMFFGDQKRRDIDNHYKICLDCMTGIVFEDDSQIYDLHATKEVDRFMPRIEIEITSLTK